MGRQGLVERTPLSRMRVGHIRPASVLRGWSERGESPNIPLALGRAVFRVASESVERTGSVVKVKASIRRMCNQCQVVRRKGKVRVICKANPKHKQVQG